LFDGQGQSDAFNTGPVTGQLVRILSGPFADFVRTLERLDDAGRVRMLFNMMQTGAVSAALRRSTICSAA